MEETAPVPLRASVVVASYNSAPALRRCLAALEASAERETFEIIAVDNGSADETPALEAEFPNVTFMRLPRNFGLTKALNIGMRTAKAELFFLLDPRAEVQPPTVTALVARLDAAPEAAAIAPLLLTPFGKPAPHLFAPPAPDSVARLAKAGSFDRVGPPPLDHGAVPVPFSGLGALMVRAYFLKGLRYIDERYAQTWADAELAYQIRRAGKKTLLEPNVRCTWYNEPDPFPPDLARSLIADDWVAGASTFAGKHFGFLSGLKVKIAAALAALVRLRLGRVAGALSGRKLDGTVPI